MDHNYQSGWRNNQNAGNYTPPPQRTVLAFVLKTLLIHFATTGNYILLYSILRRNVRSRAAALRILVFFFCPSLVAVEGIWAFVQSFVGFIRNQENEDDPQLWFHFSAAMGMHAVLPTAEEGSDDDLSAKLGVDTLPLRDLTSDVVTRKQTPLTWVWAAELGGSVLALAQGVVLLILWARRIHHADPLHLDHRNGAMAIAATICSVLNIIVLSLRSEWTVSRSYRAPAAGTQPSPRMRLLIDAYLALLFHLSIACLFSRSMRWMYISAGLLFIGSSLASWQNVLLMVVVALFRRDIAARVGLSGEKAQSIASHRSWKRVKVLLVPVLSFGVCFDIVWVLVHDIVELVHARHYSGAMWQDPSVLSNI